MIKDLSNYCAGLADITREASAAESINSMLQGLLLSEIQTASRKGKKAEAAVQDEDGESDDGDCKDDDENKAKNAGAAGKRRKHGRVACSTRGVGSLDGCGGQNVLESQLLEGRKERLARLCILSLLKKAVSAQVRNSCLMSSISAPFVRLCERHT